MTSLGAPSVSTSSRLLAAVSAVLIAGIAFSARLIPVLNGGGLYGYGNYDDGVYFAAGQGLASGRLPYRNFLILHPPGIAVALAPFGWLAQVTSDPTAFAVARVVWMAMGAFSAVLVLAILWPSGRFGAMVGGLGYAVFYGSVYGEHSTLLEGPQNLVLLIAILIITRCRSDLPRGWRRPWGATWPWLLAGFVLGLSPAIKIWGVVPVLVVAVWVGIARGRGALLRLVAGVVVSGLVVMGPFFAAAPIRMWRLVVIDQLGRLPVHDTLVSRLIPISGLDLFDPTDAWGPLLIGVCAGWLVVAALAALRAETRLFAVLYVVSAGFLLIIPSWFVHYSAFVAPGAALSLGGAAIVVTRWLPVLRPGLPAVLIRVLAVVVLAAVLATVWPLRHAAFGRPFPAAALATAGQSVGCVTTDDPTNLIELNLQTRDLEHGCRLVVDLQGYANDQPVDGRQVTRLANPRWQRTALDYLGSGGRTVISRLGKKAFTEASLRTIRSWPELARSGYAVVREPDRAGG